MVDAKPYFPGRFAKRGVYLSVAVGLALALSQFVIGAKGHIHLGFSQVACGHSSAEVYVVDTKTARIGIYGRDANGTLYGTFQSLQSSSDRLATRLVFATNGGMFNPNYDPVGLLVQDGVERSPINLKREEGNFYLMPNGVFLIFDSGKVAVIKSEKYAHLNHKVTAATQSGPLLVVDGRINPAFRADSPNRLVRSGVGVVNSHTVVFALSNGPVNFWDFAHLFRNELGCKNALYLDGVISQFYIPNGALRQEDGTFGVLIGVTQQ